MKKLLVGLWAMVILSAHATTVNIDWLMDGATYAQTTCETGGIFSLPTPTPTKYGYHFVGWQQNDAVGSWAQSGTPTPDNPIYPTFAQYGNTVLRALGSGNNFVADSYDATTGKITRRVGVKVLDGTGNNWDNTAGSTLADYRVLRNTGFFDGELPQVSMWYVTHFKIRNDNAYNTANYVTRYNGTTTQILFCISEAELGISSSATVSEAETAWKQWLANQYANGTPVTVYYPLARPVEENYNAQ